MQSTDDLRLRQLLSSRKGAWSLSLLLGWITFIAVLGLLATSGWFITASAAAGLLVAGAYSFDFFRPAAIIRLAAMTRTAGRYAERLSSHNAVLALLEDLRRLVFGRLAANFDNNPRYSSARQQHRLVADIDLLDRFPLSVTAPWFWACSILALLLAFYWWLAPQLMLAALIGLLPGWLLLPLMTGQAVARLARQDAQLAEERRVFLLQSLQLRVPLVIWRQWHNRQRAFLEQDLDYLQHQHRQQSASSRLLLWQHWALAAGLLAMLWVATPLLATQQLQLPWLVAALLAYLGFYEVLAPLTSSFIALGLSQAARDRLNQLGHTASPAEQPLHLTEPVQLELKNLQVSHAGEQRFDLQLQAGDILLVTGPSGSGKTSLLETLAGYLPALQGQCQLNGQSYRAQQLHGLLGYLPQQFDLFNLSLADNLRLGTPKATDAQLWQALEQVNLAEWAKAQPLQLNTPLGEHAIAVSGGQARRIALARLLLRRQALMLLDEPFAGLDKKTAALVLHAVSAHQRSGILVIVSHDVPTELLAMDRVKKLQVH